MRNLKVLYLAAAGCMWLLSSVAGHSASAVAEPASSQYTDVVNALQTTKPVRLLTDLGQCRNESAGQPSPSLQGGLTINTFIVLPGRGLFFSDVHQTLDLLIAAHDHLALVEQHTYSHGFQLSSRNR